MRLVKPFFVPQNGGILSTDVDMEEAEWADDTTYNVGNIVRYWMDTCWRLYEALVNHSSVIPPDDATHWKDLGPANQWALFDRSIGTATTQFDSFYYEIQCQGVTDALAVLNFRGTRIVVQAYDNEVEVYNREFSMVNNQGVNNWFAYFFQEVTFKDTLVVRDLPTFVNLVIRITFYGTESNPPSVGLLSLGKQFYAGRTQYGSSIGLTDFSVKQKDNFGGFMVVERPYSDIVSLTVMIDKNKVDPLKKLLAAYRAKPLLVIGTDCYDSTTVYGFYRDFSIVLEHHNEAQCSIEFEGVT